LKRRACLPGLRGDGDGGEALAGRLPHLLFSFFCFPLFPFDSVPVYFSFPAAPEMTKEKIMKMPIYCDVLWMNTGLSFVCRDENGFKDNSRHCVCVLPSFSLALWVFISARLSVFPLFSGSFFVSSPVVFLFPVFFPLLFSLPVLFVFPLLRFVRCPPIFVCPLLWFSGPRFMLSFSFSSVVQGMEKLV